MAYQSPWQNRRTPAPSQEVRDRMRAALDRRIAESRAKGYGPARFDTESLNKSAAERIRNAGGQNVAKQMQGRKRAPTVGEINKALAAGQTISISTPSDCFTEVTFQLDDKGNGMASATFRHKTEGTWSYSMSADEFLNGWARADSLGGWFNSQLR